LTDASEVPAQAEKIGGGHLTVSVGICSNRPGSLHAAVSSVLANTTPPFDLVVVAQGGDPGWATRDLAQFQDDPRLRIIYDDGKGVSRARNIAFNATDGDIMVFTDDDCLVASTWVEAHASMYRARPEIMMIFGKVAPPDTFIGSTGMVPTFDPAKEIGTPRLRGRIALGLGANMSLRRSLAARIGIFDEMLGPGAPLQSGEEFDLALRATAAGARVIADSRPVVVHAGGVREVGAASRTLWQRDGFALGALIAKQARVGHRIGVVALVGFLSGIGLDAVQRTVRRQRPYNLKMSAILLGSAGRGLVRGLRQPITERGVRAIFSPSS
jgi:glycosyltransferase involved in cell wall biosynthesis